MPRLRNHIEMSWHDRVPAIAKCQSKIDNCRTRGKQYTTLIDYACRCYVTTFNLFGVDRIIDKRKNSTIGGVVGSCVSVSIRSRHVRIVWTDPNPGGGGGNGIPGGMPGGRNPGGGPGMPGGPYGMGRPANAKPRRNIWSVFCIAVAGSTKVHAPGGIIPIPRPAGMPRPGPGRSCKQTRGQSCNHQINLGKPLTAFFLSSSTTGGGPSTLRLTTVSPRKITRPSVRFMSCGGPASASPCFFFGLTLLNSSQSASTRFICLSKASICPVNARPSFSVIFSLQLMRLNIFPPLALGGACIGQKELKICQIV